MDFACLTQGRCYFIGLPNDGGSLSQAFLKLPQSSSKLTIMQFSYYSLTCEKLFTMTIVIDPGDMTFPSVNDLSKVSQIS